MSQEDKIYLKITHSPEGDIGGAFLITTDRRHAENWKNKSEVASQKNEISKSRESKFDFRELSADYYEAMEVYIRSVPFVMSGLPILMHIHIDKNIREYAQNNGNIMSSDSEFETYELDMEHAEKLRRRVGRVSAIKEGIDYLPNLFLIGIITAYDIFISRLIKVVLITRPEILSSSEKNISFSDIVSLGSIEAARDKIIDKEIDILMRGSHSDQIDWMEKKLDLDLRKNELWPKFLEICERRNLLAHTGGIVSQQYVSNCKKHQHDIKDTKIGDLLAVTPKYYNASVKVVLEYGLKILQIVWRKLKPDEIALASSELNQIGYDLIDKRNFKLAANMYDFGLNTMKKHGSEAQRRTMVINFANACKMDKNIKEALKILEKEDWSASAPEYKLYVAAIKDDLDGVLKILPLVKDAIQPNDFRHRPIFDNLREKSQFIEAFEHLYGVRMFSDEKSGSILTCVGMVDPKQEDSKSLENKIDFSDNIQ